MRLPSTKLRKQELQFMFDKMKDNQEIALIYNEKPITYKKLYELSFVNKGKGITKDFSPDSVALLIRKLRDKKTIDFNYSHLDQHPLVKKVKERFRAPIILWTSGSAGKPKGVVHDSVKLLKKFENVKHNPKRILAFLHIDHIGGLNTMFHTFSSGGSLVVPQSLSPNHVFKSISTHKVQVLPTTPTFLRLALATGIYKEFDLSSIELVTYGTESCDSIEPFRVMFSPKTLFKQTYGMSELGILSSISKGNSAWVKLFGRGYDIRVVNNMLEIKAESSMEGYTNAPSPFTHDGYLKTHDIVQVDGEYVKILGKDSDVINVGGLKVYPTEVEGVVLKLPYVSEALAYGISNFITGQAVGVKVAITNNYSGYEVMSDITHLIEKHLPRHCMPVKVEKVDTIDHSERFKKVR